MTFEEQQKQIQNNVDNKVKRYNKTELSIQHRWAVNCAVQMAVADKSVKSPQKKDYTDLILEWRDWFIEMDREWMAANTQEEIIPITEGGLDV